MTLWPVTLEHRFWKFRLVNSCLPHALKKFTTCSRMARGIVSSQQFDYFEVSSQQYDCLRSAVSNLTILLFNSLQFDHFEVFGKETRSGTPVPSRNRVCVCVCERERECVGRERKCGHSSQSMRLPDGNQGPPLERGGALDERDDSTGCRTFRALVHGTVRACSGEGVTFDRGPQ